MDACISLLDGQCFLMDSTNFHSISFQRVYQYIKRYSVGYDLDAYSFDPADHTVEGTPQECITLFLKYFYH